MIGSVLVTLGFGLWLWGTMKYRRPDAPAPNTQTGRWILSHQDWFSTRGQAFRVTGVTLMGVGGIVALIGLL